MTPAHDTFVSNAIYKLLYRQAQDQNLRTLYTKSAIASDRAMDPGASQSDQHPDVSQHRQGNCQPVIYEAAFMAAVEAVGIRTPPKKHSFGDLVRDFCNDPDVQASKDNFLAQQELNCKEGMEAAMKQYYLLLSRSDYKNAVRKDVAMLTNETGKATGPRGRHTSTLQDTRLDFAAQGIWQVPCTGLTEGSTDNDAIEEMRASAHRGGYTLAWLEALYRARGEGNEEGVGSFIIPLLDLRISDPGIWEAFKRHEFLWVFDNFNQQGFAMSVNLFPSDFLKIGIVALLCELHHMDSAAFQLMHVELLELEDANQPEIINAIRAVWA